MSSKMVTVTVMREDRGCGAHMTIVESPYAEALAVIDGLARATDNATYRGVTFGKRLQSALVIYLRCDYAAPEWAVIRDTGRGPYHFDASYLDSFLAAAAQIEALIARAMNLASEMGRGADTIQDACIARMEEVGLNPNQVAERLVGQVSRAHICDFLTRRSSIGSHKLQHLLAALGLEIAEK